MSTILHIETSTKNCSVSIANCGELMSLKEINTGEYSHAEMLHPLINEALLESKLTIKEIEAIAVGKGPGSYTGLRIGVSAAKGLCFANDIPLISINSLEILAQTVNIDSGLIIPMIDARRMEVYAAIYDNNHNAVRETKAEIIDQDSFLAELQNQKVYFLGDGAKKCKETILHNNAVFIENVFPSAKEMATISFHKFKTKTIEDVAYFEPFYL
ncbi:tRNA (adenosine(37)-N6)-threonylcarbamoyltransferase complex dimerization subunit type 1 TsaB, partial [bacterium]|nr:tRNA (adenosine(37)-N6)-threonylcarbamoyltransferase complex dimerization subunit type 1 TsaB [bacterium]